MAASSQYLPYYVYIYNQMTNGFELVAVTKTLSTAQSITHDVMVPAAYVLYGDRIVFGKNLNEYKPAI